MIGGGVHADADHGAQRVERDLPAFEKAPATLALNWEARLKPRALLLANGMVEFNYRDTISTDVYGVDIVKDWDVDGVRQRLSAPVERRQAIDHGRLHQPRLPGRRGDEHGVPAPRVREPCRDDGF